MLPSTILTRMSLRHVDSLKVRTFFCASLKQSLNKFLSSIQRAGPDLIFHGVEQVNESFRDFSKPLTNRIESFPAYTLQQCAYNTDQQ